MTARIDLLDTESVRQVVEQNLEDPDFVDGLRLLIKSKTLGILPEINEKTRQLQRALNASKAREKDYETRKRMMWEFLKSEVFADITRCYSETPDESGSADKKPKEIPISEELYDLIEHVGHIWTPLTTRIVKVYPGVIFGLPENIRKRTYSLYCKAKRKRLVFRIDFDKQTGEVTNTEFEET